MINFDIVVEDLKKLPRLVIGFLFVALGLLFSNKSNLGMLPWGVFHTGIQNITHLEFGTVVQLMGIIILVISVVLVRVKIGIGTILNILFIGMIYNVIDAIRINNHPIIMEYDNLTIQITYLVIGIICSGFGTALYVSCRLGSGPRDGLFIGLSLVTKLKVKYTKPMIELVVLVVGFVLHGDFGVGTFVNAFVSGYVTNLFFDLLKYNPKTAIQRKLIDYVTIKKRTVKN